MEIRQLRYFIAVADTLNFSRAASSVYLSQSALSRQIMDLEKLFSVRLFNARAEIDDHIWKLRNTADEEEVQAPQLLPPPERIRNDAEILDMFQSLLEHSSDQ